jgi:hypothetical protein
VAGLGSDTAVVLPGRPFAHGLSMRRGRAAFRLMPISEPR